MKFIITVFILFCSVLVKAQSLNGKIADTLQAPVAYIPLALLNANDSSIIKGTNTNEGGLFSFDNLKAGIYLLKIEAVGYKTHHSQVYKLDTLVNINAGVINIKSTSLNLSEVSVTTTQKLIEFKNGNISVNIANSPLAVGNTLYDLLSRLPTVTVIDDNISIQGKEGVRILIDERLQQMSGQQLITLLKSIQASSIEKIEILKNPPVKYDAAGSGFISVKTKKLKITGFSGSVNADYQQGFYANKDVGLSLNYKGKSFAVFSGLNLGNDESLYLSLFDKRVTFNGISTDFNQVTAEKSSNLYAYYNIGADWYINRMNTIGFRIEGSNGKALYDRTGENNLSDGSLGYNKLEFSSLRPNVWNYVNYNFNAEHLFDTVGTLARFSFDYSPNDDLNSGDFENYFLDSEGNHTLQPRIFKSDNNLQFIIYSSKLDFEKSLGKTLKLEAGLKGTDQNMTTNFNFFNNSNSLTGAYTVDTALTNGFKYSEKIYAGYVNFLKEYKKFSFQLGVRGENTQIIAGSIDNEITYTRDYFNLFPMTSINYNPSVKHSYQLSYNRRINRPGYTSFNPYKYFVNLLVSVQGNPYLKPQYSHNLEFTHGYKSSFYNTLSFSLLNNIFYGYPLQNDSTKETLQLTSNLEECYLYAYSTYFQKELTKWWMFTFNGSTYYLTFSGNIDGKYYSGSSIQNYVFVNNQFTFTDLFKIELAGRYIAPKKVVIYNEKAMWAVDLGIRKNFLKNKLNVTIGMNDVFFTWIRANSVRYLNMHSDFRSSFDTRRFKASIAYNFGKVKVRQRETKSNQEEKNRLEHK